MTTLAAIYSRISHDPEGRQAGVERQEQDCRRMAAERGWTVLEPVYRENDTSASTKSRQPRPVFEQLLQDSERGTFTVLLAHSRSRLTRRPLEYERLIALTSRPACRSTPSCPAPSSSTPRTAGPSPASWPSSTQPRRNGCPSE